MSQTPVIKINKIVSQPCHQGEEDRPLRQGHPEGFPAVLQQAEVPQAEGGGFGYFLF